MVNDDGGENFRWEPSGLIFMQEKEQDVNKTIMVLESNSEIMTALQEFYQSLAEDPSFPVSETQRKICCETIKRFSSQLGQLIYDIKAQISRGKILSKQVMDSKNIVWCIPT
jgi:hypothetical protein